MYAIVDIETTGGSANYHRITDIAIVIHNGKEVIDRYESLINPERYIPPGIIALTGITNEMVENAPLFKDIADKILEYTKDQIFVAHNANFDYGFLKAEFSRLGIQFQRKKLCTVRLSRNILPGYPSYSLGNLCNHLNIPIYNRHRAGGDADATACLFSLLVNKDEKNFILHSLKRTSNETLLPPNLPREQFEKLPAAKGIYYLHDKNGKVVYVGKANNLKKRVSTHFAGTTNTKYRQNFINTIHAVSFQLCGTELISLLLENEEIKKHWPRYNRAYKSVSLNYGLYNYQDQEGYERLVVGQAGKRDKPLITFKNMTEATSYVISKVKSYNLCLKLCGVIESREQCTPDGLGWECPFCQGRINAEVYNRKFHLALTSIKSQENTFVILGKGIDRVESSVVVVEKGKYLGFGYIPADDQIYNFEDFKNYIKTCYDNQDVQNIIYSAIKKCQVAQKGNFTLYKSCN